MENFVNGGVVEAEASSDTFGTGSFKDLLEITKDLMSSVAPEVGFGVEGKHSDEKIIIKFTFEDADKVGLFFGKNAVNMKMLFHFLDNQQIFPHNRKVRVLLDKGDEVQKCYDRHFLDRFQKDSQEES